MRGLLILALGGGILAGTTMAIAQDAAAGRKVAGMCRTCHGLDGYAKVPIAPHIGGEPQTYLRDQLLAFKDGTRQHEMMSVVTAGLSEQQIADVAAWYASHTAIATPPDPSAAPQACVACHGANGLSQAEDAPNLAGETNIYIDTQLKAFKRGKRQHDIMSDIAASLEDDEIRAIADYYAAIGLKIEMAEP